MDAMIAAAVEDWAADVGMVHETDGDEQLARELGEYHAWLASLESVDRLADEAAERERAWAEAEASWREQQREAAVELAAWYDGLAHMELERKGWPHPHPLERRHVS